MAGLRRIGRVGGRLGRGRRAGGCWRVGSLSPRILEGVTSSLRLVSDGAAALCDVLQLLGVRLEAVGAAAPVDELLGPALQALEINENSRFARVVGHYDKSPGSDPGGDCLSCAAARADLGAGSPALTPRDGRRGNLRGMARHERSRQPVAAPLSEPRSEER